MRIEDAPPAGWYPDPEGGSRLRWWDGTDWSGRYRPRPPSSSYSPAPVPVPGAGGARHAYDELAAQVPPSMRQPDAEQIVEQVRQAARAEAERAAEVFGAQARSAAGQITPLITEYTSKFIRWFRFLAVVAIILVVGWVVFQVIVQASIFEWIGDRIDSITDNGGGSAGPLRGMS